MGKKEFLKHFNKRKMKKWEKQLLSLYENTFDMEDIILECFPRLTIKQGKMTANILFNRKIVTKNGMEFHSTFRGISSMLSCLYARIHPDDPLNKDEYGYLTFYYNNRDTYDKNGRRKVIYTIKELKKTRDRLLKHRAVKEIVDL